MTVTDRDRVDQRDSDVEPAIEHPTGLASSRPWSLSWPVRLMLASCSLGAAGIHLAMVPAHAGEWLAEGVAFALTGWFQFAVAMVLALRPSKLALQVAAVANAVFIAAWVWTRTAGPPFGPEAGVAHAASFVDVACVALEAAFVVLAVLALARPRLGEGLSRSWYVPLSIVPVSVLVLATAAIASPSASGHADDETAGGHVHSASAAAGGEDAHAEGEAAGHDHGGSAAAAGPVDDKGLASLANGEMAHSYGPDQSLDATTRAVLVHQLALTRLIAERFPTLKDAKAAGSEPAGAFGPGMGIHMLTPHTGMPDVPPPDPSVPSIPGTLSDAEILRPANLLYDGTTDDAPLAGFMYYSMSPTEPEGFAGPNDHWHTHGGLCIKMGGAGGKIEVLHPEEKTRDACTAITGLWVERTTWMVHVWTVPGYESNRGVFSDINPALACPDGTYYTVPESETAKYQINKCRSNPA